MTIELTMLIWSTALFGLYVSVQAICYRAQYGVDFAATARDVVPAEANVWTARSDKALRNLIETYPVFLALAVATVLAGRSDGLTQWGVQLYFWARIVYLPLYLLGIKYVRSLVWLVAMLGLVLMFFGVLL